MSIVECQYQHNILQIVNNQELLFRTCANHKDSDSMVKKIIIIKEYFGVPCS